MSVFFSGFIGNESERQTHKLRVHGSQAISLFRAPIHSNELRKRNLFLAFIYINASN